MAGIKTIAKAEALAAALYQLTGVRPKIEYRVDRARLYWEGDGQAAARRALSKLVKGSGKQSDIELDYAPVVVPLVASMVWPYVAGLLFLGYVAGKR